jgi:hypothetical protein
LGEESEPGNDALKLTALGVAPERCGSAAAPCSTDIEVRYPIGSRGEGRMRYKVVLLPGIPHLQAVRALDKAAFKVVRESKHIVMTDGQRIPTIPRANAVTPTPWAASFAMQVCRSKISRSSYEGACGRTSGS